MKIIILSEGGSNIGFGHMARCSSLYDCFERRGIKPNFIINTDTGNDELLRGRNYEIVNWLKERKAIFKIIKGADIAVIDSYLADLSFYGNLSRMVKVPVYIDDNKRLDYPAGIVVNSTAGAEEISYSRQRSIDLLLGSNYALLRKEFWSAPKKTIRSRTRSVMTTFGGDDFRDMTPRVLSLLNREYPALLKYVIIGGGFKGSNIKKIEKMMNKNTRLIYRPSTKRMKEIMLMADLVVSAGGQTLYELARIGVPTIGICIADNQRRNLRGLEEAGFLEYAGKWNDAKILNRLHGCIERLKDHRVRVRKSAIGRRAVDGKGSKRICDFILRRAQDAAGRT
ncbi:MAG: glycosyltransferase [Candidatus Omnitrophica bacterium]|nr:glycosyltransferase [Candidatus Omnitrophota bacterium]